MTPPRKMYARFGTQADLQRKITDALKLGANEENGFIEVSVQSETALITVNGHVAMRAVKRAPDQWLCLYNEEFYPKPE